MNRDFSTAVGISLFLYGNLPTLVNNNIYYGTISENLRFFVCRLEIATRVVLGVNGKAVNKCGSAAA